MTLNIADSFYTLNNIQVNKGKSVLLTNANIDNNDTDNDTSVVTLNFGTEQIKIKPVRQDESVRVLGVWINLKLKKNFVLQQIKSEINSTCRIMKYKRLTDEHLLYVFNHVVIPRISYKMQLTVLSNVELDKCNAPFRALLKNKSYMSSRAPNYITQCNQIYKATSLTDHQLITLAVNLTKRLNDQNLLGLITQIRWMQLQQNECLTSSPFNNWTPKYRDCPKFSYIASALSVLKDSQLTLSSPANNILGGSFPLIELLTFKGRYRLTVLAALKKCGLVFLSQLMSFDGSYLLT
jgi:hypothetical protein